MFSWKVCEGFKWKVAENGYEWYLDHLPVLRPREPVQWREYKPQPSLFRTFAETELTPEGMFDFAQNYGELGEATRVAPNHLSIWGPHIEDMRAAIAAWESGVAKDKLKAIVNKGLKGRISPQLDHDAKTGRLALRVMPTSLLVFLATKLALNCGYRVC
jgi:hypothetical protein